MNYKSFAKKRLDGKWGMVIGAFIITVIASYVTNRITEFLIPIDYTQSFEERSSIIYMYRMPISVAIGLLIVPLTLGVVRIYYRVIDGLPASLGEVFIYYKEKFLESIVTMFLVEVFIFLWSLLLIVPGIIKAYSYSLTPYIFVDEDLNLTGTEAITLSRKMMKGRKFDLFILHLSFIGWFILSIFTLGLLLVYVVPYLQASVAAFYLETKNNYLNKTESTSEELYL